MRTWGYICAGVLLTIVMTYGCIYTYHQGVMDGEDYMALIWLNGCTDGMTIQLSEDVFIHCGVAKKPSK